ncbi:MAG TPA: efflux RND transporter periplasmic adaptor subunit [Candidatus Acidoferrum sp.]|jgi:membrane fusion protein (multidrug efflux system)|nr:efflux RND transporter periplasmic adaptor subunit [Candidatus Acidoferrum sp.]
MNKVELQQNGPGVSSNGLDDTQARRNVGTSAAEAPGSVLSTSGNQPTGVTWEQAGKPRGKRRVIAFCAGAAVLIAGLVLGFIPRWRQGRTAVADMNQLAIPTVSLVSPTPEKGGNGLTLPAEIRPWREASIYARANGYLKDWVADIGAHVKAGQLLGEIETPDLDQQLAQARAQLVLAQANLHLAEITDNRWKELLKTASVSEQAAAEKAAARETAAASVEADRANMRRLQELVSFQRVVAPFAGTITLRNTDIGDLIVAGSGGKELFHIAQTEKLRVYVRVPESYAQGIAPGHTATLTTPATPGRSFEANVTTTSESISTTSRTLLVELEVDNSKNQILPYSYGELTFKDNNPDPPLTLPSSALVFRTKGLQVGVVGSNDTVQLRAVQVGRDFGQTIEVTGGVAPTDRVIANPTDSLVNGLKVRIAQPTNSVASK